MLYLCLLWWPTFLCFLFWFGFRIRRFRCFQIANLLIELPYSIYLLNFSQSQVSIPVKLASLCNIGLRILPFCCNDFLQTPTNYRHCYLVIHSLVASSIIDSMALYYCYATKCHGQILTSTVDVLFITKPP